ncbi:hypothetical protein [Pedobacter nyackensis]|uniref:Uncharacterized protein n=1 Tax=Pedobacter nyackensis TaxID=475255 RepID=A0A1W2DTP6_9SPHI|nr:hypothetical protein [Pedobacter nyackensis]SMD00829.1 hypothetical protein SAMN04488101_10892 [Pedobacter nyackensis]
MENMENEEQKKPEEKPHAHKPIEHDYAKHQADPGPPREAVEEEDINGAAVVMRWLIPLLVVALLIYWLFFK